MTLAELARGAAVTTAGLVERWRQEAEVLRRRQATTQADVLSQCAQELEDWMRDSAEQPLTLAEAAAESGYSTDHLARLVRQGKLCNLGRPHAPLIRRGDLPRKPPALPGPSTVVHVRATSPRQVVRAIAEGGDKR